MRERHERLACARMCACASACRHERLCVSRCASSTAMCICVRLQDPNEKPLRTDSKYFEKACKALLKKVESGQDVTYRMLQKEKQRFYRRDYKAWHKKVGKNNVHATNEHDKEVLLTDLGYGALNIETWCSPPPLELLYPRAHSPPPSACQLPLVRSPETPPRHQTPSSETPSSETPSSYFH